MFLQDFEAKLWKIRQSYAFLGFIPECCQIGCWPAFRNKSKKWSLPHFFKFLHLNLANTCKKPGKIRFPPAFGMLSTEILVKIYNTWAIYSDWFQKKLHSNLIRSLSMKTKGILTEDDGLLADYYVSKGNHKFLKNWLTFSKRDFNARSCDSCFHFLGTYSCFWKLSISVSSQSILRQIKGSVTRWQLFEVTFGGALKNICQG